MYNLIAKLFARPTYQLLYGGAIGLTLLAGSMAIAPQSAEAIPGEPKDAAFERIEAASILPELDLLLMEGSSENVEDIQVYFGESYYDSGDVDFWLVSEDGVSTSEMVQFRYPTTALTPVPSSNSTLTLIRDVWANEAIAVDFANSNLVERLDRPDALSHEGYYYRGDNYGYMVSIVRSTLRTSTGIYTLAVFDYERFEEALQRARRCHENPYDAPC